jgi:uncharacterized Zn-finger protein
MAEGRSDRAGRAAEFAAIGKHPISPTRKKQTIGHPPVFLEIRLSLGLASHSSLVPSEPVCMANDRIDCSYLVSEFRSRTKIALPISTLELNLLMNQ